MTEINPESSPQPRQPIKATELTERMHTYLTETNPPQEGFLERKKWNEELARSLGSNENILVVFADIAGAGQLGKEINNKVKELVSQIDSWQKERITQGRRVETRRRPLGSDEFLIFSEVTNQGEAQKVVEELNNNFNRNYEQNQVHLGAAFVPSNCQVTPSETLRGADIALGKAKEANKAPGRARESNPKLLTFKSRTTGESPPAVINQKPINHDQLTVEEADFPPEVIQENAVPQLRQYTGSITAVTPTRMKKINQERGMSGGDQVLTNIVQKIINILEQKEPTEKETKIFKIGPVFAFPHQLTPEQRQEIDQLAPYGIEWTEVEVS